MNLEEIFAEQETSDRRIAIPVCGTSMSVNGDGPWTLTTADGSWRNMAFTGLSSRDGFEVEWKNNTSSAIMFGIMKATPSTLQTRLNKTNLYTDTTEDIFVFYKNNCQLYPTKYGTCSELTNAGVSQNGVCIGLRFCGGLNPKLEFRVGSQWIDMKRYFGNDIQPDTEYCPVFCISASNGTAYDVVVNKVAALDSPRGNNFHQLAKFLISNNLEICESSSLKALGIMQKYSIKDTKV